MLTKQEIICTLRKILNQIYDISDIEKLDRLIDEFLEKYEIWNFLQQAKLFFDTMRKRDLEELAVLGKKAEKQINRRYKSLILECKKQQLDIPKSISNAYTQKDISSLGLVDSKFDAVRQLILLLFQKGHKKKIKKFIKCTEDETGILECNFSSMYTEYEAKKNILKKTPWYCIDQLIRFKNKKMPFDPEIPFFQGTKYLFAREALMIMLYDSHINIDEYKACVQILFDCTKSYLLKEQSIIDRNEKIFIYKYTDKAGCRNGTISDGQKTHSFEGKSAALAYIINKKGRISKEDAGDFISDTDSIEKKEQVNNAVRVINDGMLKAFLKPKYISSRNGILSVNYQTKLLK